MELWKDANGYEGYFMVSNQGRVRTLDRRISNWPKGTRLIRGRVLSSNWLRNGYPSVSKDGVSIYCHRMVAENYVSGKTNDRSIVNHIDGNKRNNKPENLEWVTSKENAIHASKNGLLLFSKAIIRSEDDIGVCKYYPQISQVVNDGFSRTAVNNCLKGWSKVSSGFFWRYYEGGDDISA